MFHCSPAGVSEKSSSVLTVGDARFSPTHIITGCLMGQREGKDNVCAALPLLLGKSYYVPFYSYMEKSPVLFGIMTQNKQWLPPPPVSAAVYIAGAYMDLVHVTDLCTATIIKHEHNKSRFHTRQETYMQECRYTRREWAARIPFSWESRKVSGDFRLYIYFILSDEIPKFTSKTRF